MSDRAWTSDRTPEPQPEQIETVYESLLSSLSLRIAYATGEPNPLSEQAIRSTAEDVLWALRESGWSLRRFGDGPNELGIDDLVDAYLDEELHPIWH